jgi:putative SOS response-associated peptidase YedK
LYRPIKKPDEPYFCLPSDKPFAFAGLYETWEDKEAPPDSSPFKSCTIITTEASESVRDIHNRMPLILKPEAYDEWLDPETKEPAKVEELLKSFYVKELKRYPVSRRVNRLENTSKE